MRTPLQNGDVVEIIRGSKREVPADWRSLTVTGRARSAIRRHIRTSEREEFIKLGRVALDQTLGRVDKALTDVSLKPVLELLAVASDDDLFEGLGRGRLSPTTAAEILFPALKGRLKAGPEKQRIEGEKARLFVRGGADSRRVGTLRSMLHARSGRPDRRHSGARIRPDRPHHRLPDPGRLRR